MKTKLLVLIPLSLLSIYVHGQVDTGELDIESVLNNSDTESQVSTDKVIHAEPLYIDLIRDLGARKGEKEWNLGLGLTDNIKYDSYDALIEYEFAPVNRLGLEIELPFIFYSPQHELPRDSLPSNQLEGLQLAVQWTFLVKPEIATSMALGYLNEFEMSGLNNNEEQLFVGNVYNPFLVVAKRWGQDFHTLIYTGPVIEQEFETSSFHTTYDINTSFHYMIPETDNFVGLEFNKSIDQGDFDMTIRPQMRLGIAHNFLVGIVCGIPAYRENERLSFFVRLIWEPE